VKLQADKGVWFSIGHGRARRSMAVSAAWMHLRLWSQRVRGLWWVREEGVGAHWEIDSMGEWARLERGRWMNNRRL
jgi:hypothetical protein